eukprot:scaffold328713_cov55-Tisochrysis_lutea.AAC.1
MIDGSTWVYVICATLNSNSRRPAHKDQGTRNGTHTLTLTIPPGKGGGGKEQVVCDMRSSSITHTMKLLNEPDISYR